MIERLTPALPPVAAVIVAAGRGQRFGDPTPKQYLSLAGVPVLRRAVECFARHPGVGRVIVAIRPDDAARAHACLAGLACELIAGGAERQDSVRAGLEYLAQAETPPELALIHDAARPLVAPDLIDRILDALSAGAPWPADGALPCLTLVDTIKQVDAAGVMCATLDRNSLRRAQTPQGFRFAPILAAHRAAAGRALTDDAAVAEAAGLRVLAVDGDPLCLKITDRADLAALERVLGASAATELRVRTASGFDVHAFGPGDHVTLCGVRIPHDFGLVGHSDADVALHALTDAILGLLGEGDIGKLFPPSDPQWRGADSCLFLTEAARRFSDRGGVLDHVDLTLICERPKIGPHREAMRARIAAVLGLAVDQVSVKATTTEKLGFTGRGEGIAVQALATGRLATRRS